MQAPEPCSDWVCKGDTDNTQKRIKNEPSKRLRNRKIELAKAVKEEKKGAASAATTVREATLIKECDSLLIMDHKL